MTDNIETIIKALEACTEDSGKGCVECPYLNIFIKKQKKHLCFNELMKDALNLIIDLNEKYIKRAKWIELNVPTCSSCGYVGYTNFYGRCKTKFCPECGSEMSGGNND